MSMHLEKVWITTTVSNRRSRDKEPTKAQIEHEKWLRSKGLHPEQLKMKKKHVNAIPSYKTDRDLPALSNTIGNGFKSASVIDNLSKEKVDVQAQILSKAARVSPIYNKGGYQYVTPGEDVKTIGSRSRRG